VLMHIIADSYSTEHATRDTATEQIITIKGWRASRFDWPDSAKTHGRGNERYLLLHTVKKPTGDDDWGTKDSLSPTAGKAAEAIKDLLLAIYAAHEAPASADALIGAYFEQHFSPYASTHAGGIYTFPNDPGKAIPYTYDYEYQDNSIRKNTLFEYDRYPQWVPMATVQTGLFNNQFIRSYGIEMSYFYSPGAADRPLAFFRQLPYGFGLGLSKLVIPKDHRAFESSLRARLFFTTLIGLPAIGAFVDLHAGAAAFPFVASTHLSALYGADLVWNLGGDFYLHQRATKTFRLALGYEHDNTDQFYKGTFRVKLGLNTWHGRRGICGEGGKLLKE